MGKNKNPRIQKILVSLGDAMRNRRIELELTQQEVGQAAQLHRTYVTDVENGVRNISFLTLVKLADALNSPLSQLLHEAEKLHNFDNH
ncbi:MAG: helix-turn-helix transcriptional regulator [Cyanobacteria bacterium SZAS LIN-2]|nr:helix-turn-helix transcriptional regulator [Cyanobacteria bacterium SZAS LIN-2]